MDPQEFERVYEQETRHFWYRGLNALALAQLRRAISSEAAADPADVRVLDAGCGTGGLLDRIAREVPIRRAIGLDLSPIALSFARRRGSTRGTSEAGEPPVTSLLRGSIGAIPLADASVDAVVSLDVLYHRGVGDDLDAVREMSRVVRGGGVVLLNLPAHPWLASRHDRAIHGARRYTKTRIRELARDAGLDVVRVGYWNSLLFPLMAAWRLATRGRAAGNERSDVALPLAPINFVLAHWLRMEARLWSLAPLPIGLSLFAVLRRRGPSDANANIG